MSVTKETADYVLECLYGYQKSEVLFAACKLKLFDAIQNHENATVEALAEENSWDEKATRRLVDLLVSLRMLSKTQANDGKYIYSNTENGRLLCHGHSPSLWGEFLMKDLFGKGFNGIPDHVKGIKKEHHHHHHHHHHHGNSAEKKQDKKETQKHSEWYSFVYGGVDEEAQQIEIAKAKNGYLDVYADRILGVFDLSQYQTAVDLGGGSGNLCRALCRKHPHMRATVIDQEDIINISRKVHASVLKQDEVLNIEFLPGDICEIDVPKAELYMMSMVSHHLSEEQWKKIMSAVYANLQPGGGFLLLEAFLSEEGEGPIGVQMSNLLVSSRHSIKSREEYISNLKQFGFSDVQWSYLGGQSSHGIIFARK